MAEPYVSSHKGSRVDSAVDAALFALSPSGAEPELVSLGEGVAFEIDASGAYAISATGDTEITITPPAEGVVRAAVQIRGLTVSTGALAATYRAEDVGEGITAQAASYAGQMVADTSLRIAQFLIGGTDVEATFTATLSDDSATDDPIAYDITGTGWYLVTVAYRAGSAAQTLDWDLTQTNTTGALLFSAIPTDAPGATGAASLAITSAAHSGRLDLDTEGLGGWLHAGREGLETVDSGPAGVTAPSTLVTGGDLATGTGPEVSFSGISPAIDYVVTVAGVIAWSATPGAGVLQLNISAFASGGVAVESIVHPAPIEDTVYPRADLTRAEADLVYSAQGHGHSDLSQGIADGVTALQSHEATKVHVERFEIDVPVSFIDTELVDAQVIPFRWPISGYVDVIKAFCRTAPTTDAAEFTVKYSAAWNGTPVTVAAVSIAASAYSGSQTTITNSEVTKDGLGVIEIAADTGGTCKDGYVSISINPGDVVPGETPPDGRIVLVEWTFDAENEADIDRFEILRDGSPVWHTTDVTARTASLYFYYNSIYSLRACLAAVCSELAPQLVTVLRPALAAEPGVVASASSERISSGVLRAASNAIDGRASTFWWSVAGETASFTLYFGSSKSSTGYRINFGLNYGVDWVYAVSDDDVTYTTVETVTGNTDQIKLVSGLTSHSGRYRRWSFTESALGNGYLINEIEVDP